MVSWYEEFLSNLPLFACVGIVSGIFLWLLLGALSNAWRDQAKHRGQASPTPCWTAESQGALADSEYPFSVDFSVAPVPLKPRLGQSSHVGLFQVLEKAPSCIAWQGRILERFDHGGLYRARLLRCYKGELENEVSLICPEDVIARQPEMVPLQTVFVMGVGTPAEVRPGDDIGRLDGPPETAHEIEFRGNGKCRGYDCLVKNSIFECNVARVPWPLFENTVICLLEELAAKDS